VGSLPVAQSLGSFSPRASENVAWSPSIMGHMAIFLDDTALVWYLFQSDVCFPVVQSWAPLALGQVISTWFPYCPGHKASYGSYDLSHIYLYNRMTLAISPDDYTIERAWNVVYFSQISISARCLYLIIGQVSWLLMKLTIWPSLSSD